MGPLVASPSDSDRLVALYRVATLAEVLAKMLEWGDPPAFLDEDGRLCVPDRPPNDYPRQYITGPALEGMYTHYGVESDDPACLRRRMVFEGGWAAEEVGIEHGRIFVATEPQDT